LSIVILTNALVLHRHASEDPGPYRLTVRPLVRRFVVLAWALLGLAVVTGTVVTGSGPHGGDERAHRFDLAITSAARIHSVVVLLTTGVLLVLATQIRRGADWEVLGERLTAVLVAVIVQGTIGYVQYFNDVPVPLVALHVVGVVVVWWLGCELFFATRRPLAGGETPAGVSAQSFRTWSSSLR
jgi:cytochrome c oxidase assembly protein subunit 15